MSTVIGYKATYNDMTCGACTGKGVYFHYQYCMFTKFIHDGEIAICKSGFHFCTNILDIFRFYDRVGMRIFKVHTSGDIIHSSVKSVCSEIEFVEQLNCDQIIELIISTGHESKGKNDILRTVLDRLPISYNGDQIFKMMDLGGYNNKLALIHYIHKHCRHGYANDIMYHLALRDSTIRNTFTIDGFVNNADYRVRRDLAKIGWNNEAYLTDKHNRVRTAALKYKQSLDVSRGL